MGNSSEASGQPHADRGVSDVVAIALLVAMVIAGALAIAAASGHVLQDTRDRSESMVAVTTLQEVDARLSTLSRSGDGDGTDLVFGAERADAFAIEEGGSIEIAIDGGICNATVPLTSIRYEHDGSTITYEAGGIWETRGGDTHLLTPPDLRYRNHTIGLSVVRLSGDVGRSRVRATALDSSTATTAAIEGQLFSDPACLRPDSVTIAVRSDRHRAWGRYLVEEFGLDADRDLVVDAENRTVRVTIPQRMLPAEADDDRNQVVDFGAGYGHHRAGNVSVEKGVSSRTYPLSVTLLSEPTQGGRPEVTVQRNRRPIDVVLTMDESRSMAGAKLWDAQLAGSDLVGMLDPDVGDRAGVVGYSEPDRCWHYCWGAYRTNARVHEGLTDDFDDVNESLEEDLRADGGTPIAAGLDRTTDLLAEQGRDGSAHVAVLLTDGRHNGPGNATAAADRAAEAGITVYTVGFGDDVDESTLRAVANRTGGRYYHAEDGAELREQFQHIGVDIRKSRSIRSEPLTVQAGPATLLPNGSLQTVPPNGSADALNDPVRPRRLAYSSALGDGQALPFSLTAWNCEDWVRTNETVVGPDGHRYDEVRCIEATSQNATIDASASPERIRTFTAANTTADLPDGTGSWVESNLTAIFRNHGLLTPDDDLALDSNQVVLAYDLRDGEAGEGDFNDLVLLVEVGYATDEVTVRYAVDVTVSEVHLGTGP